MYQRIVLALFTTIVLSTLVNTVHAQPVWTINLLDSSKKPKQFEERKLGSEKMAEKKFTWMRHLFQNNFTHFNYYYNANNKINTVIERAKIAQVDDYTQLLPFYPYSLTNTASQKTELDSVLYKATAGILLHDLRNDWIDNMYLLMGQAYFLKQEFDSAAATFQFINYNLFPRDKNEEDSRIVGTASASSNGDLSIANKEKSNVLKKLTAQPPSRNDALLWLSRTLIEQNEGYDAASLMSILQHDANLPKRLVNDLEEITAYWFYKQSMYDSAAAHLANAIRVGTTKQDRARSTFLLAQLYELTHQYDKASDCYNKASLLTTSPLLDIYAQLNNAKMMKGVDSAQLKKSIDNLLRMVKKDRFETYRDILYFSAGDLALQLPDSTAALAYYQQSLQYSEGNMGFKNKTFLKIADISYDRKQFKMAYAMYDSLQVSDTALASRLAQITERKNGLAKVVEKLILIETEDSLQRIAAMPELERTAFVKKQVRALRKAQGLKADGNEAAADLVGFDDKKNEQPDLFASAGKGEWYFYNADLKSKGTAAFKRKWGQRTNADNWRRQSALAAAPKNNNGAAPPDMGNVDIDKALPADNGKKLASMDNDAQGKPTALGEISYAALMGNLPLQPEQLANSNSVIAISLFEVAQLFQTDLEDYPEAINYYLQSLQRFPDSLYGGDLYLGLYFCYNKMGNAQQAAYYKNLLNTNFASSKANQLLLNTKANGSTQKIAEGTQLYQDIYNKFIEGDFTSAVVQKKLADSLYGNYYWSPQLLYIEAIYFIKQEQDSVAIASLKNIISLYPKSGLATKATTMIDVLGRRKSIEAYLENLTITRATDDVPLAAPREPMKRNDSALIVSPKNLADSLSKIKPLVVAPIVPKDSVKTIAPVVIKDSVQKKLPLVAKDNAKTIAPIVAKDSIKKMAPIAIKAMPKPTPPAIAKDSVKKMAPATTVQGFVFDAAAPQMVVMLLDKVDGTYINESKNAFTRYVNDNYGGRSILVDKLGLDNNFSLITFSSFADADAAWQFVGKIRKAAPEEVSWLPAAKYSFFIISANNLQLLQSNKNIKGYQAELSKQFPGKL